MNNVTLLSPANQANRIGFLKFPSPAKSSAIPQYDAVHFKSRAKSTTVAFTQDAELNAEIDALLKRRETLTPLGIGVKGVTYKLDSKIGPLVVKLPKKPHGFNFRNEADTLSVLPDAVKAHGQALIAYGKHPEHGDVLITRFVSGSSHDQKSGMPLTAKQLPYLFNQIASLDSHGILHGDIGHGNWLLEGQRINLIDYEAGRTFNIATDRGDARQPDFILTSNLTTFEAEGLTDCLVCFTQNNQTAKMRPFFKAYLQAKADYHQTRAEHIATLDSQMPSTADCGRLAEALRYERIMAAALKKPSAKVIAVEAAKEQVTYAFGQAYKSKEFSRPIEAVRNWMRTLAYARAYKETVNRAQQENPKDLSDYLAFQSRNADHCLKTYAQWAQGTTSWLMEIISQPERVLNPEESRLVENAIHDPNDNAKFGLQYPQLHNLAEHITSGK